jgi:hypothetical protein
MVGYSPPSASPLLASIILLSHPQEEEKRGRGIGEGHKDDKGRMEGMVWESSRDERGLNK